MPVVTVLGKPGCHLCDDAVEALERLSLEVDFEMVKVNILENPALKIQYAWYIPTILIDGEVFCKYHVQIDALKKRLKEVKS
jgi:glutaredoxin